MKKTLMFTMMMITATVASAQTRSGFEAGVDAVDYQYHERMDGATVAKDSGRFFGVSAGYTKVFANKMFVGGNLAIDFGSADYRSDETRVNGVDQQIGRLEFHLGRDFATSSGVTLSPFVGLASRVLQDNSGGRESSDGLLGYDRTIGYRFVPVGASVGFPVGSRASMTLSAQYNHIISGHAESKLSQVDAELSDVRLALNGGSGYDVAAILRVPVGRKSVGVGPFITSWNVKQSRSRVIEDVIELFEPANRTTQAGVRVVIGF